MEQCSNLTRLSLVRNSARLSVETAFKAWHCSALTSGPFFSFGKFETLNHVKRAGMVVENAAHSYTEYGYAWDAGELPTFCILPCAKQNYFTCVPAIINGVPRAKMFYTVDAGGTRQRPRHTTRPGVGIKGGEVVFHLSGRSISMEQAQAEALAEGFSSYVILDGGGSSCLMDGTRRRTTSRILPYYLCRWDAPAGTVERIENGERIFDFPAGVGGAYVSTNFRVSEFRRGDVSAALINILQDLRDWACTPVKIVSTSDAFTARISVNCKTAPEVANHMRAVYGDVYGLTVNGKFLTIDARKRHKI